MEQGVPTLVVSEFTDLIRPILFLASDDMNSYSFV